MYLLANVLFSGVHAGNQLKQKVRKAHVETLHEYLFLLFSKQKEKLV